MWSSRKTVCSVSSFIRTTFCNPTRSPPTNTCCVTCKDYVKRTRFSAHCLRRSMHGGGRGARCLSSRTALRGGLLARAPSVRFWLTRRMLTGRSSTNSHRQRGLNEAQSLDHSVMEFLKTKLPGVFEIHIEAKPDERGFFARTWCQEEFETQGLSGKLVQCSLSFNRKKGTLRGMHFQI